MRASKILVALTLVVTSVGACGADDERPTDRAWASLWSQQRDSVPDASVFETEGEALCGDLVGSLRAGRVTLLPSPNEILDDAVEDWVSQAESVAFDCPSGETLNDRLHDLSILAAEVDAGLEADAAG